MTGDPPGSPVFLASPLKRRGEPEISEQELRTLVDVGAREGVVDRTEREMIHGVFELEDTLVREVMVPRPDMFCLDVATPREDILPLLRDQLHSRVPVFEDTVDQVVGVLYTKDLLPHRGGLPDGFDLRAHLHPPYFVPESKRADALLREFQAKRLHLAIVVDEYGSTAGLVSLEDLLEDRGRDPRRVRRGGAAHPHQPTVRLVGLLQRGNQPRAAIWIAGTVVVLAVGEEAEGYRLLGLSDDEGVRLRSPSGEEITLGPPGS